MSPSSPSFDPQTLALAVEALGEALQAVDAHEKKARTAAREALREKARTGRLKPLRAVATGPVPDARALEAQIASWDVEALTADAKEPV